MVVHVTLKMVAVSSSEMPAQIKYTKGVKTQNTTTI